MKVLQSRRRAGETLSEIEIPPPLSGGDMHRIPVHSRKNPGAFNPLCRSSRQHEDERRVYRMVDKSVEFSLSGCTTSKFFSWNGLCEACGLTLTVCGIHDNSSGQSDFVWKPSPRKFNPFPLSVLSPGAAESPSTIGLSRRDRLKGLRLFVFPCIYTSSERGGVGRRWRWWLKWRPKGWSIASPRPPLYPRD